MRPIVVHVGSEAVPFAKTGGLADVLGALPRAQAELGARTIVITPLYRKETIKAFSAERLGALVPIVVDGQSFTAQVWCAALDAGASCAQPWRAWRRGELGAAAWLVDVPALFQREGLYGPPGGAYADNPLRFTLFVRAAIEAVARFVPETSVLHVHDWQAALLPLLLRRQYAHYPRLARLPVVLTIHNLAYQGVFEASWRLRLGLPEEDFHPDGYEFYGQINFLKAGILASDRVTTVSPTYAREILTPGFGCGLDGFLRRHAEKLSGILNGLDTRLWDPATDPQLPVRYRATSLAGKGRVRAALLRRLGLKIGRASPLFGMVSRLVEQKGVDLVADCIPRWVARGWGIAVLGSGDPVLARMLKRLAAAHPEAVAFIEGYDEALARWIYAGADLFLMPSRFEPCGLAQMIAMRYGTPPVVRATGGLKDTVVDADADPDRGTGFAFDEATPQALDAACRR
ncbi:MAG: glycogen synthase, partial [Zetaproteobacteria bacterium]